MVGEEAQGGKGNVAGTQSERLRPEISVGDGEGRCVCRQCNVALSPSVILFDALQVVMNLFDFYLLSCSCCF